MPYYSERERGMIVRFMKFEWIFRERGGEAMERYVCINRDGNGTE